MTFLRRLFLLVKLYPQILKDPHTSAIAKVLPIVGILYLFFPIDLIPDFIPLLGLIDDGTLLIGLIYLTVKLLPEKYRK